MKNKIKTCSIIFSIILSIQSFAKTGTITGIIEQNNKEKIEKATVLLLKYKDSSIIKTEITNEKGYYTFNNVDKDSLLLSVSYVGKKTAYSPLLIISENGENITQNITLSSDEKNLKEAKIIAKKPIIQVLADKTVFNVEQSINAIGNNALQLLQKSPGVVVDKDENILLKGKSNVRIYINGKPSVLEAKDLAGYLKSMQATDIEAIEIISNPGAKYEAAGTGGIINIKLKKNKKLGTNGSVNIGAQFYKYVGADAGLTLNHRSKKANIYGTYSWGVGKNEQLLIFDRYQSGMGFYNKSININDNKSHNIKTGMDYTLNSKSTLGAELSANFSNTPWNSLGSTLIGKTKIVTDSVLTASNDIENKRTNINANINYRYADTANNTLGIDADYGLFQSRSTSYQPNYYTLPDLQTLLHQNIYRNNTPIDIDIKSLKIDAERNAFKGKIGFGAKTSFVTTQNNFKLYDVLNGADVFNTTRSNIFKYTENINALYANYNRQLNAKLGISAGLRAENTTAKGVLNQYTTTTDSTVHQNYTSLFPSAGFSFVANTNNNFSVNYSRRIDRPSYQDLNPFENKIDELTYQKGNPYLRPQFSNIIELNNTYKNFLNTSLSYSHTKDKFMEATDTTEVTKTYITNKNFGSEDIVALGVSAPIPFKKWWNAYVSLGADYNQLHANFNGRILQTTYFHYYAYAENNFTLPKDLSLSISGFYNGPMYWGGTFKTKPFGMMDIGLQKLVYHKAITLKLSVSDVLKTNIIKAYSNFSGLAVDFYMKNTSRQLKLNIAYRFGNKNVQAKANKNLGADESKRIKQGK